MRNIMKYIKTVNQHYRNGKNWGDSWWFITKMMLKGNLLTDDYYGYYLRGRFGSLYAVTGIVQPPNSTNDTDVYTGETK